MSDEFNDLLAYDPLHEAELVTGKSYKDDEATAEMGLRLALAHAERMEDEMWLRDDTHYTTPFLDTLRIYADLGFEVVLDQPFTATDLFDSVKSLQERFILLWRDGILVQIESYGGGYGGTTNTNKMYYNWKPNTFKDSHKFTSSGHFSKGLDYSIPNEELVWVGDSDVREGLRHKLDLLTQNGTFLSTWEESPFLFLVNYQEQRNKGYNYKMLNAERINALPDDVQKHLAI